MKTGYKPSVMNHRFSEVPSIEIPRSMFNRSHGHKTTFDAGYLVPIFVDEAIPGDTMELSMEGFARLATPIYPTMDNMFMDTFFFAVPIRILYDKFKNLMGERQNPSDTIDYSMPILNDLNNVQNEDLADYLGIPTQIAANIEVRADFFRAYNKIWNDWFRDQNLQDSVTENTGVGPDSIADYELLRRCKKHDYFTSCLPWLQKGDAIQLSLGTSAPVDYVAGGATAAVARNASNDAIMTTGALNASGSVIDVGTTPAFIDPNGTLIADLTAATASTVNELRQAIQLQRLLERDARSGSRYIEIVKSHFSVDSQDSRMQRPEYLGGGSTPVLISPIARTDSSPGVLGAAGLADLKGHGFVKSFTEHCIVIGLVNVRADITYQEGLNRMWNRSTRYDFPWPTLAHLGEQEVKNKEIYLDATTIGNGVAEETFGYQERYAELRYMPSRISGKLRSNDAQTLDAWHLSPELAGTPTLDSTFIQDNPPVDRIIAVPSEPHFIFDSYFHYKHTRPLPIYSVPGFIDHF